MIAHQRTIRDRLAATKAGPIDVNLALGAARQTVAPCRARRQARLQTAAVIRGW